MFKDLRNMYRAWRVLRRAKRECKEFKMDGKLKSRKLWVTIAVGVLFVANGAFGFLPPETLQTLLIVACTYLFGQSFVDGLDLLKRKKD